MCAGHPDLFQALGILDVVEIAGHHVARHES
jgi:hypothetical protein